MSLPDKASNFHIVYLQLFIPQTTVCYHCCVTFWRKRFPCIHNFYFSPIILFISSKCSFLIGISCFMKALSSLTYLKIFFKFVLSFLLLFALSLFTLASVSLFFPFSYRLMASVKYLLDFLS